MSSVQEHRDDDVQDVLYAAAAWKQKSGYVHGYRDVGGRVTQEQLPRRQCLHVAKSDVFGSQITNGYCYLQSKLISL